jgi:hypothetical protein
MRGNKMKITVESVEVQPVKGKSKISKNKLNKKRQKPPEDSEKTLKNSIVGVPTSKMDKLVDKDLMRKHNFLSVTTPMLTKIFRMKRVDGRSNKYEVEPEPHHVSAIMKLILTTMQTNELGEDWSTILWNITQSDILPEGCMVTFTRSFERKDNVLTKKKISRRRKLSIVSSDSGDNIKRQNISLAHDMELANAIDTGDSVVSFGAEAIVTAPDEPTLEAAVDIVQSYLAANDETRGLHYALDINKQNRSLFTHGPNEASGNKDVIVDMTSYDAAKAALFVDSGGDRRYGAEYIGVSVGKLIKSHAAYNLKNQVSLFVGNDTTNKTSTLAGDVNEPSQIYWSKLASRAYLLTGQSVTHFVADDAKAVNHLMGMPISEHRKCVADVSKGLFNMLEPVDDGSLKEYPERILSRFPTHINNIITLLGQYRDVKHVTVSDDFANLARDILIDFFVDNKYWSYDARYDLSDIRLFVEHQQFKKLSDFGQYIEQRRRSNKDTSLKEALDELNTIVNRNILPTIPALDTKTDSLIDDLVKSQFRIVDLTGMSAGASGISVTNPSLNVMMISYLNLLLPSMKNGDVIVIHGVSRLSSIANIIKDIIANSGLNLDVVYTEKNQNASIQMLDATSETVEEEDATTHKIKKVKRATPIDFTVIDLYNNRSDKLCEPFGMNKDWSHTLKQYKGSFFIKTETGLDYIYLDKIL